MGKRTALPMITVRLELRSGCSDIAQYFDLSNFRRTFADNDAEVTAIRIPKRFGFGVPRDSKLWTLQQWLHQHELEVVDVKWCGKANRAYERYRAEFIVKIGRRGERSQVNAFDIAQVRPQPQDTALYIQDF